MTSQSLAKTSEVGIGLCHNLIQNIQTYLKDNKVSDIYSYDIIKITDGSDRLYGSVDALIADIKDNPHAYGISGEIMSVAEGKGWRVTRRGNYIYDSDIVVWTACDVADGLTEDDMGDDEFGCGLWVNGEYICGWHVEYETNWKSVDVTTLD